MKQISIIYPLESRLRIFHSLLEDELREECNIDVLNSLNAKLCRDIRNELLGELNMQFLVVSQ